jgi:hypothetical protein
MQPIFFDFAEVRNKGRLMLGVGPSVQGIIPLPTMSLGIVGITRDATGAPLAGCTVDLFRTLDDVKMDTAVSDAGGNFAFSVSLSTAYYLVAYKVGAPDVAGVTVNTLVGA